MDQKVDGELHLRISGPIWPQRAYMLALAMIYNSNGVLRIQFANRYYTWNCRYCPWTFLVRVQPLFVIKVYLDDRLLFLVDAIK